MFPHEGVQGHLARNTKDQWGSNEKDSYRAEWERVLFEVELRGN